MPTRSVSKFSASSLRTLSSGLHLIASRLTPSCYRGCISVKPYAHRSIFPTGICHHRRIQPSIFQDKNLVSYTYVLWRIPFSYLVSYSVIFGINGTYRRIHSIQQIIQHPVGHLFCRDVMNMQEVCHSHPKPTQRLLHPIQSRDSLRFIHHGRTALCYLTLFLAQAFRSSLP